MENQIRTENLESPQLKSAASYCDDRIAIIDNPHALMGKVKSSGPKHMQHVCVPKEKVRFT